MAASGGHWVKGAGGARFAAQNAKPDELEGDRQEKPWYEIPPSYKRKAARLAAEKADQERREKRRAIIRSGSREYQELQLRRAADLDREGKPMSGYRYSYDMPTLHRQFWYAQQALVERGWLEHVGTEAWPRLRLTPRGRRALARLGK